MEARYEVKEESYNWLRTTVANEIVGIFETYPDYSDLKRDEIMYGDFIGANQVVNEIEELDEPMYEGWDAFMEARKAYKEDMLFRKEGE